MARIPSLAALESAFPQSDRAALEKFRRAAKTHPNYSSALVADAAIQGYGVCVIRDPSRGILARYVNTGDTYSTTLLWNAESGSWRITTWGDWVEQFEKRHGRKRAESLACY